MPMDLDLADVKPSVVSWVMVTLLAVTGIALLKWVTTRWRIPGLTELVNAV